MARSLIYLGRAKEPGSGPVCLGDHLGYHGQAAVLAPASAVAALKYRDLMDFASPVVDEARVGLADLALWALMAIERLEEGRAQASRVLSRAARLQGPGNDALRRLKSDLFLTTFR